MKNVEETKNNAVANLTSFTHKEAGERITVEQIEDATEVIAELYFKLWVKDKVRKREESNSAAA